MPNQIVVTFPAGVFARLLTGEARAQLPDVPTDARVLDCGYDWRSRSFYLVLEHPAFPPVEEGLEIPRRHARITVEPRDA